MVVVVEAERPEIGEGILKVGCEGGKVIRDGEAVGRFGHEGEQADEGDQRVEGF